MTNCNIFVIGGNVSSDVRLSKNGKFGYFDVAVNRGKTGPTYFIPVRVYMNDYFKNNIKKGVAILLQGRFESGSYTDKTDGSKKYYSFLNPVSPQHENNAWIGLSTSVDIAIVQGNLASEPELKQANNGNPVVNFRVACNHYAPDSESKSEATYLDVSAWDNTAEFISKYFHKGNGIMVDGYLASRSYKTNEGANRTAFNIVAEKVSFASWKNKDDGANTAAPAANAAPAAPAPAAQTPPDPNYGGFTASDFQAIDDENDLPF